MCIYNTEPGLFAGKEMFSWVLDYLHRIAPPGKLPRRQDIDPVELRHLVKSVNLIDVIPEGDSFRLKYRLVGSLQTYFFANGKNPEGHYLDEFWGEDESLWDTLKSEYRRAIATSSPVLSHFRQPRVHSQDMIFQRALFPLGSDGTTVDCFLGVHEYHNRARSPLLNQPGDFPVHIEPDADRAAMPGG